MKTKTQDRQRWARPAQVTELYGIPRGSLYRLLSENPGIRTANLRGPGSARLVNVADLQTYLEKQAEPYVPEKKKDEAKTA